MVADDMRLLPRVPHGEKASRHEIFAVSLHRIAILLVWEKEAFCGRNDNVLVVTTLVKIGKPFAARMRRPAVSVQARTLFFSSR
jgi:hypothetical protein